MRISRATVNDAEVLARLNDSIHTLHCQLSPAYFQHSSPRAVQAELAKMLTEPDTRAYVAWDGESAIGYCIAKVIEREPNAWTHGFRRLLVDQISVERPYRQRDAGKLLMEAAYQFAREYGIDEIVLEYWTENDLARRFYKSLGFAPLTEKVLLAIPTPPSPG